MRNYVILGLAIAFIVSIVLGFYLYRLNKISEQIAFDAQYEKFETDNIINETENVVQETSSGETKTTPNTTIIEKKYYKDCDHLIKAEKDITENLINKNESEFQSEYMGWEIQKFTPNEVVVYKEINDFCDEHFLAIDEGGTIVVYKLDKYGNRKERERTTSIQTKYLSDVDIENLKNGIKVNGVEELNSLIEDYE